MFSRELSFLGSESAGEFRVSLHRDCYIFPSKNEEISRDLFEFAEKEIGLCSYIMFSLLNEYNDYCHVITTIVFFISSIM